MKRAIHTAVLAATVGLFASPAWAHTGPGAAHDLGLFQSLVHIFSNPDHWAKIVLVAGLLIIGSLALRRSATNRRDPS